MMETNTSLCCRLKSPETLVYISETVREHSDKNRLLQGGQKGRHCTRVLVKVAIGHLAARVATSIAAAAATTHL